VPQAKSSGSKSASTSGGSQSKRSSTGKSTGAKQTTRKSASSGSSATGSASSSAGGAKSGDGAAADPRLEAVAQRIRKLNERIIAESRSAGEATLSSYENALKAIASTLERGPGKSDIEWISSLASAQAKFIREVTDAWTSAARGMLK
jgi:hypothetical protein